MYAWRRYAILSHDQPHHWKWPELLDMMDVLPPKLSADGLRQLAQPVRNKGILTTLLVAKLLLEFMLSSYALLCWVHRVILTVLAVVTHKWHLFFVGAEIDLPLLHSVMQREHKHGHGPSIQPCQQPEIEVKNKRSRSPPKLGSHVQYKITSVVTPMLPEVSMQKTMMESVTPWAPPSRAWVTVAGAGNIRYVVISFVGSSSATTSTSLDVPQNSQTHF